MRPVRLFFSHWQNIVGIFFLAVILFTALAAPILSPANNKTEGAFKVVGRSTDFIPRPPSDKALLGTLPGQLDVYHAVVWGTRDALQFGLTVAVGAFIFGVIYGAVAGYAGGAVNSMLMRIADIFLTFPLLAGVAILQQMVAVTIVAMGGMFYFNTPNSGNIGKLVYFEFEPPMWVNFLLKVDPLLVCLILLSWVPYARLVNASVMSLKRSGFIQASQALGGGPFWVIRRHLLPNSIAPAVVMAARDIGNAVILQATFTYIGLGSISSWGTLLSKGRDWVIGLGGNVFEYWWVFIPVTLAAMLFGITWNIIGDGLSEALQPEASERT